MFCFVEARVRGVKESFGDDNQEFGFKKSARVFGRNIDEILLCENIVDPWGQITSCLSL